MLSQRDPRGNVLFRLSGEQRAELERRARAAGLPIQEYLELKALGAIRPRSKGGRPCRKNKTQEELPLSIGA